jgi:hypothetical protein
VKGWQVYAASLEPIDGKPDTFLFVSPFAMPTHLFGCVFRSKHGQHSFTDMNAIHLEDMISLKSKSSISQGISSEEALKSSDFSFRLRAPLEVLEILTGMLDI